MTVFLHPHVTQYALCYRYVYPRVYLLLMYLFSCLYLVTQGDIAIRPGRVPVNEIDVVKQENVIPNIVCNDHINDTVCKLDIVDFIISYTVEMCVNGLPLMSTVGSDDVTVTRLYAGSPPVGGTFSLSFEGRTISGISATAEESEVKTALERELGGTFEVSRDGSCSGYEWSVRWSDRGGDLPLMGSNGALLTGDEPTVNVIHDVDGGVWLRPLRGDMLRLPELDPQVGNFLEQTNLIISLLRLWLVGLNN